MAVTPFAFDPPGGWNDAAVFPTYETSEMKVRSDLQELHDQTRDFINGLIESLGLEGLEAIVGRPLDANMKYLRISDDGYIETSLDGETWARPSAGGGGGGGDNPRLARVLLRHRTPCRPAPFHFRDDGHHLGPYLII